MTAIQHSYKKNKMLPTIHQPTQVDDCYERPAARVPSDSYTILYIYKGASRRAALAARRFARRLHAMSSAVVVFAI